MTTNKDQKPRKPRYRTLYSLGENAPKMTFEAMDPREMQARNINPESLAALSMDYLISIQSRAAPATLQYARRSLEHLIRFTLEQNISTINPSVIDQFFMHLRTLGLEDATIHVMKCKIRGFFKHLEVKGLCSSNPVDGSKLVLKGCRKKTETITYDEYDAIKKAVIGTWMLPAIVIAYNTGMRISDILSMEWTHIDMVECVVKKPCKKTYSRTSMQATIPFTKTSELGRLLSVMHQCRKSDSYIIDVPPQRARPGEHLNRVIRRITNGKTIHAFRRTFASNLLSAGVDTRTVMTMLGVTEPRLLAHYSQISVDALRDAVEKANKKKEMYEINKQQAAVRTG